MDIANAVVDRGDWLILQQLEQVSFASMHFKAWEIALFWAANT
jgi:hypothetical protein